jgi:pyrimidine-nucleoside phosphorylase/thymidine phosphorylase
MNVVEMIRRKRDGGALSTEAIDQFFAGVRDGSIPDYQQSAMLMAITWRGLDPRELDDWTEAMRRSGEVLDLRRVPGPKIDKHSTGGVGDKVSLCLAPLVAACGVRVPMIAGRGLGHTGGTIDKLESIPGFRADLSRDRFEEILSRVGCCIIGQTDWIAPADRQLYALRDVTGTVESIPLIAASIMSKKLAEGIDGLVLDVKVGGGAFMKERAQAEELARTLVRIGEGAGVRTRALLTQMDQPLGRAVGNALELAEAYDVLCGGGPADLRELTLALGVEMLALAEMGSPSHLQLVLEDALRHGRGREKLLEMVAAQGGDAGAVVSGLPRARGLDEVCADAAGYVMAVDAGAIGEAVVSLGAGRRVAGERVDPAVGVVLQRKVGDAVRAGERLCTIAFQDNAKLAEAKGKLRSAFVISEAPAPAPQLVLGRV